VNVVSNPRRLLDEGADELEMELLRSVRADAMPDGSRRHILATLGIAGAVVTTSTTAASSIVASKAGVFKGASAVVAKWVAVSALAGLGSAGVWVARTHMSAREVDLSAPKAIETSVAPNEAPSPAIAPAAEEQPKVAPAAREPRNAGPTSPSLSNEVAALQVARTALAGHDPGAALAALDRYKSRYPAGRLAPEATVLRIEALVERGDRAQASALADRFEAANPKSPYADRIRSILGRSKGQAKDPSTR
jgi:hypothetical protein